MDRMNIGFTTVTFRKKSAEEIVRTALKNGIFHIEWGGDIHVPDVAAAKRVNALCRENGIIPTSLGSYYRIGANDSPDFRETAERTAALGADRVRVWLGTKPSADYKADEISRLLYETEKVAETAKAYGVSVAFEFHRKTLNDNGVTSIDFLKRCPDAVTTYWQPFFEGNDEDNLSKVIDRVLAAHVFSWNAACERFPLEAEADFWKRSIAKLKPSPCRDLIIEFVKDDSDECFENDVLCLKSLAAE